MRAGDAPRLDGLADAVRETAALFSRVEAARDGWVNGQGGDVACAGNHRALSRHTANYLAAAAMAGPAPAGARLVDVGGGVGAFTVWLAQRLGARPTLVDADPDVLRVAAAAFPELSTAAGMGDTATGAAWLVTAMEVVEHVPPRAQLGFVRGLAGLVAPGGALVVSTPDESRYMGRSSGYAPHVGVLDAAGLEGLLAEATGLPVQVWRLEGEAFHVGGLERLVLPMANRAVGGLRRSVPGIMDAASHLWTRVGAARPRRAQPHVPAVRPVRASEGRGSGLVAVVRFP
ncbi:MAG TPA: methyltransferase domain-containing protein [Egibacteraceae bacterium]|nr:methyltransferase domain-containing protein [Egibacteraceae bacterium]